MAVFTQKVEIILVVDRSGSLERYYEYLKRAISDMLNAIKNDPHLSGCDVYFTFITFASKMDDIKINAVPISNVNLDDLSFQCQGTTNPGPALKIAAETAISRYYQWKNSGEDAFHPLLVFFTDGYPL